MEREKKHKGDERMNSAINYLEQRGVLRKDYNILDIGCGPGRFAAAFAKKAHFVVGLDISEKMVELAKSKYPDTEIICGDAETYRFNCKFDAVMIYNAFPRFPCPDLLFENLSSALNEGGRLSVSHGAGREEIQKCHEGNAKPFSASLPEAKVLAEFMEKYLTVDTVISTDKMYMVSGVKNKTE